MRAGRNSILRNKAKVKPHTLAERGIRSQDRISMTSRTSRRMNVKKIARQDATVATLHWAGIFLLARLLEFTRPREPQRNIITPVSRYCLRI